MKLLQLTTALIATGALCLFARADTMKLKVIGDNAMPKLGGYMPQRLELKSEKPAIVIKTPAVTAPLYGMLKFADKEFAVLVDAPTGGDTRLYVDSNGNGDLTDDPATVWAKRPYKGADSTDYAQYIGGAYLMAPVNGGTSKLHFGMYRFDPTDPQRAALKNVLLYYSDYALEGAAMVNGKSCGVMISDDKANGQFAPDNSRLMIDLNGDGKFERRGETFKLGQPFNVGGTTYEVTQSAGRFSLGKSDKKVAEVDIPPSSTPGTKALTFKATTTAGQAISFPQSYKGKLVMLDFWATWCGPCRRELPHLTAAYKKFHNQGFEVLGISLDKENWAQKLAEFTKENNMPWPQVYDGKFWSAEIAVKYGVDSIPRAILVDGDTGMVVAEGSSLRGDQLAVTLRSALEKKGVKVGAGE